ncbi:rhamnogalacturonan acetylesterase [Flavobacterium sp. HJJ]|uniref:rhamnogalacturonan acetylesterase n=1 Tax=Flavobacterium sp. HJJ TaxID=2783792 RepID=UPI00188C4A6D|nr:rhamnogalacturonan acetylesterase [Flavobacterium sp. HJJ]MBF4471407.1 rhamnogalacturonan acetylesterase [Flavobacterium sp. HJJ]
MKPFRIFTLLVLVLCSSNILLSMGKNDVETVKNNNTKSTAVPVEPKVFNFESSKKNNKFTNVLTASKYEESTGYGFDFETDANAVFTATGLNISKSTYFSVKIPEGNYKVKITLANNSNDSNITVKAESRRIMIDQLPIKKGKSAVQEFNVNVRSSYIDESNSIKLKDREKGDLNWDNKLTLEFLGSACVQKIEIIPLEKVTSIFLAGDSTVTDQDVEPWASWGQMIPQYFDTNIVITNYACSGLALSSFKSSNRLLKISSQIKAGDYLFIEFGHNDEKIKGPENTAWKSYSDLLAEFIQTAKDKGAFPVLVTPTQRRAFNSDGTLKETHGDFPDAMRAVAKKMNVPLIDVTKITTVLYEKWGDDVSRKAFVQYPANTFPGQTKALEDNTHFNSFGANEITLCVIKGIRDLNLPLQKNILKQTPKYNPQQPNYISDWTLPMSTRFEIAKPDGN